MRVVGLAPHRFATAHCHGLAITPGQANAITMPLLFCPFKSFQCYFEKNKFFQLFSFWCERWDCVESIALCLFCFRKSHALSLSFSFSQKIVNFLGYPYGFKSLQIITKKAAFAVFFLVRVVGLAPHRFATAHCHGLAITPGQANAITLPLLFCPFKSFQCYFEKNKFFQLFLFGATNNIKSEPRNFSWHRIYNHSCHYMIITQIIR